MKKIILLLFVFIGVQACKSGSQEGHEGHTEHHDHSDHNHGGSEKGGLKDQLIKLHDEVMPQTMKLSIISKKIDDLTITGVDLETKKKLQERLKKSEDDMNVWMEKMSKSMEGTQALNEDETKILLSEIETIKTETRSVIEESNSFISSHSK
ncbi:MAG: hypothetical protein ACRCVT_11940 [Leadbetterella sp.]